MSFSHLTEEQLEALLAGEAGRELQDHVHRCLACQRELEKWEGFLAPLASWRPPASSRQRVLAGVLSRMSRRTPLRWLMPLAAAAVVVVVAVGLGVRSGEREKDVDAVLEEVNVTLAADPLAAVADGQVVQVVVPEITSGDSSS